MKCLTCDDTAVLNGQCVTCHTRDVLASTLAPQLEAQPMCKECRTRPVGIKKHDLCMSCYYKARAARTIEVGTQGSGCEDGRQPSYEYRHLLSAKTRERLEAIESRR